VNRLAGKIAIITGAASGIGAATARAFVAEGAFVVLGDLADEAGARLANELGDRAVFVHLDVTDEDQWDKAVQTARATFGGLSVLVNSAGVLLPSTILDYNRDYWDKSLSVNLTGPFVGMSKCIAALRESAPSSIVNISSYAGIRGVAGQTAYTASKWGLTGLTKAAALELTDSGVRANSVHPGGVRTPMIAEQFAESETHFADATLAADSLTRSAEPEEIAALIVFLASNESSFSTGAEFIADGGISAGMKLP
jgi:3alpha(or 20beta)-hydroxysteroid dehydrogenase